ncbi:hypothetical protein GCM10010967_48780 [Dyadobacter beijingensis]|uniref:histidine kinase n=1 Tax=Dyadobacter beijingensis TaxID=365489 RepID=A0ABQ2ID35_9BACT|nr:histidine kinase dimerization/phosphoacceptor domain -containing protein [Dyadobacter beijingensis]GGN07447.1 hypothetical protein GCM10010967_48780 [Dyadobacter beijingensis]
MPDPRKKIVFFALIAVLMTASPFHVFPQTPGKSGPELVAGLRAKALYSFRKGDKEQGKRLFKEAIDKMGKPGNEEAQGDLWRELAMLIRSRDTTGVTRMECFEKMVTLYRLAGQEQKEIEALKSIADLNLIHGKLDLAEAQLLQVLRRYKAIGYPKIYYVYDLLAVANRYKGNYDKGIYYALKAIETMEASGDFSPATTFYSRLANMYRELGQSENSVEWYRKVFRKIRYVEPVNHYMFRDAGFLARELIKLGKQQDALAFILDVQAKNKPNGPYAKASLLASLAFCYDALRQHDESEKFYRELIPLAATLKTDNEIATDVHFEIGRYFLKKRQSGNAALFLKKALHASEGINSLSQNKEIYLMLYLADSATGNYRAAVQDLMAHKILNDSIFNIDKSRQIEELQVRYETAKRKKDIELLHSQNRQARRIRNISLIGAALLLIIAGLLFNGYRTKYRSTLRLEAKQKELDQKNLHLEALNAQQDKLLHEKEWLIREVHHRVKNNLQMVTSLLNSQSAYLKEEVAVTAITDSLRRMQAMSLTHQKLYENQHTTSIAMTEYITELVAYLSESFETGDRIIFEQTSDPLFLDVSQAIPLGLILNEGIVNAIKYAFQNRKQGIVRIGLQRDGPGQLLLVISDNGVGLPTGFDIRLHNSLGLDLMQGLTRQLKGHFAIKSDDGVHIMVRFADLNK